MLMGYKGPEQGGDKDTLHVCTMLFAHVLAMMCAGNVRIVCHLFIS
jgi:hypothetical protein